MKKSIVTALIAATLVSSFAGVAAAAQGRGGNGGGNGGSNGGGGSDGMEYRMRHTANQRYVKPETDVFCFLQKVRRYDAYGNRYFERVRTCETRVVEVY